MHRHARSSRPGGGPDIGSAPEPTGIDVKDITMDWIAEHVWICGSEETVLAKLQKLNDDLGGFGEVVMNTHDFIDDPKPFIESMHRFAKNVVPKVRDVVPAA
jgi:hypothetical protein